MKYFRTKILILLLITSQSSFSSNSMSLPPDSIINYPCSGNTFWTLNSWGEIQEWQLNNSAVSGGQIILNNPSSWSLSYCGNSIDQTFFSVIIGGITYYNSPSWTVINIPSMGYCNSAGYKQFQYYISGYDLYYYNGTNLSFLFNANFQIADLSVDTLGRAWVVTEDFSNNAFLKVVDTLGNILSTYTYSNVISLTNAYGMFSLNNTIYVGFGNNNPVFPGKIVPIIINGTSFHFGNPISFPETQSPYFLDMASCQGGRNQIVTGYNSQSRAKRKVFPNPTTNVLNINYDNITSIDLFNSIGDKLATFSPDTKTINFHDFNLGMYTLKIMVDNRAFYEKIILTK